MSRRLIALAVAIAIVLAAGASTALVRDGDDDAPDDAGRTQASADPPPSVDETIAEVEAFVSRVRDLPFRRSVRVDLADGAEFRRRLLADVEEDRVQVELDERILRALRLLPDDVDLFDVVMRFIGDAAVGFYDAEANELVVRGESFGPYARMVLAHELTHALDDQHFGLDRRELEDDDEAAVAFQALAEGVAVRVQESYRRQLPPNELERLAEEEARITRDIDIGGIPLVIVRAITFPYAAGHAFVGALEEAGGQRRIDEAYRDPPTTTDDILDPLAWLAGRAHQEVRRPKAAGPVVDSGVFGRLSLALTLETVVGTDEAARAADGWRGDAYVAWERPDGQLCVRARFAMADAGELGELVVALDAWANELGATVDRGTDAAGFTICG